LVLQSVKSVGQKKRLRYTIISVYTRRRGLGRVVKGIMGFYPG